MKFLKYFELENDFKGVTDSFFVKDKIESGLKLTGKTVCNVGIFAVELGCSVVKNLPTILKEEADKIENKKR